MNNSEFNNINNLDQLKVWLMNKLHELEKCIYQETKKAEYRARNEVMIFMSILMVVMGIAGFIGINSLIQKQVESSMQREINDAIYDKLKELALAQVKSLEERLEKMETVFYNIINNDSRETKKNPKQGQHNSKRKPKTGSEQNIAEWKVLNLKNGWKSESSGTRVRYKLDKNKTIHLRGRIKNGKINKPAFILPNEINLTKDIQKGYIKILKSGEVIVLKEMKEVNLDNVNFSRNG